MPHLTGRILDDARPGEHDILQAGAYNLGFCALARHPRLDDLLAFWCEKSVREFVVELQRGLFTDQRWMDLVPGMFPDVQILRHEGYDVAYWNLPHRRLVSDNGCILVNGQPLVFFHFSGIDPANSAAFSRHQNRYEGAAPGVLAGLCADYRARLHDAGLVAWRNRPYAYGYLADGSPIPDVLRRFYRSTPEVEEWAGTNPYARPVADWNESVDDGWPPVSRVMLALYQARPDIRLIWPEVLGTDRAAFAHWFVESAELQQAVPSCYVEPIRTALVSRPVSPVEFRISRQPSRVSFERELVSGALRKAAVAFRERRLPLSPRRWLQLYKLHTLEQFQNPGPGSLLLPPASWPAQRYTMPLRGFYPQSPEEAAEGVAWMADRAVVRLPAAPPGEQVIVYGRHVAAALHARAHGSQLLRLEASMGSGHSASHVLSSEGPFEFSFTLPTGQRSSDYLTLSANRTFAPSQAGLADDRRSLSVQISRIVVGHHVPLDFSRPEPWAAQTRVAPDIGLTVVGYLGAGTGIAAGAHSSMAACAVTGIPSELLDARPLRPLRGRHATALLHVNADQLTTVAGMLGEGFFRDRYIIGAWAWELPRLPDAYLEAFRWVHEVWAGSRFIQGAVAEKSSVPVVRIPYAVRVAPTAGAGRARFQLPTDRFLFLTMYDALSVQDRKNPQGAIEAFRKAFGSSGRVGLVVKLNHASSRPDDLALVRQLVAETAGTYLVDAAMSREDAQALQACCDAFVSLHRAEGFGLNIAEAMLLGKPVVVTSWSGNMDFTSHRNACLVDYEMVKLRTSSGPYHAGNEWAEPDVDHAAEWMQRLVADGVFRSEIGRRGQETIATDFSPAAVGQMYRRRLEWIALHRPPARQVGSPF